MSIMEKYDHKKIEAKWQKYWEKNQFAKAIDGDKKPKFYGLIEFPYPSGEGLHVGHIRSNTAMDIICRKRRLEGYNVLYPIGWDAFGLPTENYAIKTGTHPIAVTKKNTDTFRRQLKELGFSFDWDREINTTDPEYYKWTQWIFLQLLKRGLAYKKKMSINWCPSCKIGLANEEVVDGSCERCGTPAEKREKDQWMLAITKYADRLDRDLDMAIATLGGGKEPKKILIGTRNPAKVKMIKNCLAHVPSIIFVTLDDLTAVDDSRLIEGDDPIKNARMKSEFYFKKTGLPTISTDHIFWIEKWPENNGYVLHIRKHANPRSPRASDREVIDYLKKFVREKGQSRANFHYAMAFTDGSGTASFEAVPYEYILQNIEAPSFTPGYPTEALIKDPKTGLYKSEQPDEVRYRKVRQALQENLLPRILGRRPLEYLEKIKIQQQNWIGRSEGAEIEFRIKNYELRIKVFTTRLDTIFGCTYVVLSPEHELTQELRAKITNWSEVKKYLEAAKEKSDLERAAEVKEKTGVELKGIKAINPLNGEEIPVWIADYVLVNYGTGAVMAVPAHDERDFDFAKKYGLKIVYTIEPITGKPREKEEFRESIVAIVRNPKTKKLLSINWGSNLGGNLFIGGGLNSKEDALKCALREIKEETGYKNVKLVEQSEKIHHHYFAHSKNVQRNIEATGFLFDLVDEEKIEQKLEKNEQNKFKVEWLSEKEAEQKVADELHKYLFDKFIKRKIYTNDGILFNSGDYNGLNSAEAREKMAEWLEKEKIGARKVNYKLRDWVFSRQHYWGEPIPVVFCENCKKVKQKVLIIHGFEGRGDSEWKPWLKNELEKRGFEVRLPTMTTADHPDLKKWMKELLPLIKDFSPDDIVIGHSLGSKAALHLLLKAKKKIGHLLLIGSAIGELSPRDWERMRQEWTGSDIDALQKFWLEKIDLNKVTEYADKIRIVISRDDDSVPLYTHDHIPKEWDFEVWDGFGHFLGEQIPELLEWVGRAKNTGYVPIPEKDLPVELPKVEKYQPTNTGESPLAAITDWVNVKCPRCGGEAKRETDTMPNWAGSSWYYLRYTDPKNKKAFADFKKLKYWIPVDWYNGGMEHTTLHLLYSRFWHKFLFDLGLVPTSEPYAKRTSHGMILAEGGVKMSKSKGNVINPDDIVKQYGADALRVYEMFMGPFDQAIAWSTDGLAGAKRFLEKIFEFYINVKFVDCLSSLPIGQVGRQAGGSGKKPSQNVPEGMPKLLHKTIKKVTEDIEAMKFNTAISQMMIFMNFAGKLDSMPRAAAEKFLIVLSPFAPHLAEELWVKLGNQQSIFKETWPKYDPKLAHDEMINLVIQVNGKVRDTAKVSVNISEEDAKKIALESEKIKKWLEGKEVKKVIFVKGRLVNIVVK